MSKTLNVPITLWKLVEYDRVAGDFEDIFELRRRFGDAAALARMDELEQNGLHKMRSEESVEVTPP